MLPLSEQTNLWNFLGITQCVYKPTAILEEDFQQKAWDRLAEYKSVGLQMQFTIMYLIAGAQQ